MSNRYVSYDECAGIAKKIWHGHYPKMSNGTKFAGSLEMGVNFCKDLCAIKGNWEPVSDTLEMKLEKCDFEDGRFYVRKIQN